MIGGVKETVAELVVKVGDLYKELVTNTVQFRELLEIPSKISLLNYN